MRECTNASFDRGDCERERKRERREEATLDVHAPFDLPVCARSPCSSSRRQLAAGAS